MEATFENVAARENTGRRIAPLVGLVAVFAFVAVITLGNLSSSMTEAAPSAADLDEARVYVAHDGKNCVGSGADVLRGYVGTANECKAKCDNLNCIGFVRLSGKCYFRDGTLGAPTTSESGRSCYIPQAGQFSAGWCTEEKGLPDANTRGWTKRTGVESVEACQNYCLAAKYCNCWSFKDNGVCWGGEAERCQYGYQYPYQTSAGEVAAGWSFGSCTRPIHRITIHDEVTVTSDAITDGCDVYKGLKGVIVADDGSDHPYQIEGFKDADGSLCRFAETEVTDDHHYVAEWDYGLCEVRKQGPLDEHNHRQVMCRAGFVATGYFQLSLYCCLAPKSMPNRQTKWVFGPYNKFVLCPYGTVAKSYKRDGSNNAVLCGPIDPPPKVARTDNWVTQKISTYPKYDGHDATCMAGQIMIGSQEPAHYKSCCLSSKCSDPIPAPTCCGIVKEFGQVYVNWGKTTKAHKHFWNVHNCNAVTGNKGAPNCAASPIA